MNRANLNERLSTVQAHGELPPDVSFASKRPAAAGAGSIALETLGIIRQSSAASAKSSCRSARTPAHPSSWSRAGPTHGPSISAGRAERLAPAQQRRHPAPERVETLRRNTGDNTGRHVPQVHFLPFDGPTQILAMFSGGSENDGSSACRTLSMPAASRASGAVLTAVCSAPRARAAPRASGVCIGGDRASDYVLAKEQLFRKLDDINPVASWPNSNSACERSQQPGYRPDGSGRRNVLLGVKLGQPDRHRPATVTVSCRATRRMPSN